jgi:stress-induced morphogen
MDNSRQKFWTQAISDDQVALIKAAYPNQSLLFPENRMSETYWLLLSQLGTYEALIELLQAKGWTRFEYKSNCLKIHVATGGCLTPMGNNAKQLIYQGIVITPSKQGRSIALYLLPKCKDKLKLLCNSVLILNGIDLNNHYAIKLIEENFTIASLIRAKTKVRRKLKDLLGGSLSSLELILNRGADN